MPRVNVKAIDLTIIVATNGLDDDATSEAVDSYIQQMGESATEGVRAMVHVVAVRKPKKDERAAARDDESFTAPFDE